MNTMLEEYNDPILYDVENVWAIDDDFYLELAQEIGGPVLDIACGTGRLTRAIAAAGIETTGLDIVPAMLDHARSKQPAYAIDYLLADCRTMQLDRSFQLMLMTSHGFQHLYTDKDIAAFLERAYAHLKPGGTLAFETRNFAGRTYVTSSEPQPSGCLTMPNGDVIESWMSSKYDATTQLDTIYFKTHNQTTDIVEHSQTVLRYVTIEQLNQMLRNQGFSITAQYGYWDKSPVTPNAKELITLCQKR